MRNKKINYLIIIITTLIIGLFNTLFIRPEDVGTWKNYVGYVFLVICAFNIGIFIYKLRKKSKK